MIAQHQKEKKFEKRTYQRNSRNFFQRPEIWLKEKGKAYRFSSTRIEGSGLTASKFSFTAFEEDVLGCFFDS